MAERLLALMTMQMYAVTLVRVFSKLFAIFLVSARRTFRWIENDHQLLSEKALEQFIYEVLELLMDGVCGSNGYCWVLSGLWFHRLNLLAQCDGSELAFS